MSWKNFFYAFFISIIFGWSINLFQQELENFFIWQLVKDDPQMFLAQAGIQPIEVSYPIRKSWVENLDPESFSAISIISAEIKNDGSIKFLFQKNPDEKRPIASLTKLMGSIVVLDNLDLMQPIEVSKKAISQEESFGQLKAGETLLVHDLLYIVLMESSNDAMYALAEEMGIENFVQQMNLKAKAFGMQDTFFVNPTGVDPDPPNTEFNYSTARNLIKLAKMSLLERKKVWDILNTDRIDLYRPDGVFHHTLVNTNRLINSIPRLVGAKTGWTPLAKGCLLLVQKTPSEDGFLVYVILGSEDRFGEMEKLVEWTNEAWKW